MEKIIFTNKQAIGDNLIFTMALRELHQQYSKKFLTGIETYYPEIYYGNKYVTLFDNPNNILKINVNYFYDFKKDTINHIAQGYIDFLNNVLNLNIKLNNLKPDLFLFYNEIQIAQEILEENNIDLNRGFWLLFAGFKQDIPLKNYSAKRWQEFVYKMNDFNIQIVQVGDNHAINPKLKGCINLIGKLDLRWLFSVAYLSKGLIGHVSLPVHLAAALNKPNIVIAGGRENINLIDYKTDKQTIINSIGKLDCCKEMGCWKRNINECINFENGISHCMDKINVLDIVDTVLKYEYR